MTLYLYKSSLPESISVNRTVKLFTIAQLPLASVILKYALNVMFCLDSQYEYL